MTLIRQIIVLLICLVSTVNLNAQNSDPKKLEREIKISGNFYYGDGSDKSEEDAKKLALEELKLMISEDVRESNSDVTTIDFQGFETNIGTITIPMEGRVRVIAFLQKKEVKVNPAGEKRLMVIRLSPDGPALVGNENSVKEETRPKAEVKKTETATPKSEVTQPTATPETTNKPESPEQNRPTAPKTVKANQPAISQIPTNQTIDNLLKLSSSKEVGDYLNENKGKGVLMFGRLSNLQNPEKCYFVIIKDGRLLDVLDKSSSAVRKGLMSGKQIDYKDVSDTIYWIYIIEN